MTTQSKPTPRLKRRINKKVQDLKQQKKYENQIKKLEKEQYTIKAGRALFTPAHYNKKVSKEKQNFFKGRLKEIPKEIKKIKNIMNNKNKSR
jgi:hypothetical protein